ncbi:LpxI family protein [Hyphococcus sp.]|uniref:LpxI family protein n=1 Tax=Hyphococcus sp. TaxID=2038636 RepID=UPI002080115F|nr:MAG: UDP-2,3-diacylglucosamine pyrophosphatase [Marinicaulis sp.]
MARWRKLGVIAGSGALPVRIAAASAAQGAQYHVIRLAGMTDPALLDMPGDDCAIGEAGKIIRILKQENCDAVVFAGHVPRPDFSSLKADWRGAAMLSKVLAAAARGDGALLSVLVETLESEGMIVIGVEEAVQGLTAPAGALGAVVPTDQNIADIRKAAWVVQALGPFDVGQGAVVAAGLVLAIEAAEGTDAMLVRCAMLPNSVNQGGVLVKRPKPGQELRIDLPVIGAETIRCAAHAGLAGIAVEEGVALIIDIDEVVALADEAGLFVYGFTAQEVATP